MPTTKRVVVVSGRRKTAVAKAVAKAGLGRVRINHVPLEIFEPEISREKMREPLVQAGGEAWKDIDIDVRVHGGGIIGQAEAARMAIANALLKWTKSAHMRTVFTQYDRTMIVGDARKKETKKFGGPGARAKEQKSYR